MPKFKIIHFQPYEHQLLQNKLNQLGEQGYLCQDLSFISYFKKVDHPVYYVIDFHHVEGKNRIEKNKNLSLYYKSFLKEKYKPIYYKQGMHVFVGHKPLKGVDLEEDMTCIRSKHTKYLFLIPLIIFLMVAIALSYLQGSYLDTFSSYGITLTFIGLYLFLLTLIFRFYNNYHLFHKMANYHNVSLKTVRTIRYIYLSLIVISSLLIGGGMIEDTFNLKKVSIEDHPILLLNELHQDIHQNNEREFSYQSRSSFFVKKTYTALEVINNETALYTKEYHFSSTEKCQKAFEYYAHNPQFYSCIKNTVEGPVIYGYIDDEQINTLIIQNKQKMILISSNEILSDQQMKIIIDYYS